MFKTYARRILGMKHEPCFERGTRLVAKRDTVTWGGVGIPQGTEVEYFNDYDVYFNVFHNGQKVLVYQQDFEKVS